MLKFRIFHIGWLSRKFSRVILLVHGQQPWFDGSALTLSFLQSQGLLVAVAAVGYLLLLLLCAGKRSIPDLKGS